MAKHHVDFDLEATSWLIVSEEDASKISGTGAVNLDGRRLTAETGPGHQADAAEGSEFKILVEPRMAPILSELGTALTTKGRSDVDNAPGLAEARSVMRNMGSGLAQALEGE